ncbi:hypothetical protein [Massilia suwonensis]|uniref:HAF repeat-containing protein n=1 Tax=Massilia suwonensis TaxID=648895 RepID=A0ABW0MN88_9BURK
MQRFQDKLMLVASVTRPLLRLPILLFALTAGGTAVGQQAQPNGVADSRIIRSTYTTYRVVNLAAGRLAAPPDINAKGQVAFSMQAGGTRATGYLYDGTAVRNIGTLGGNEVLVTDLNDLGQVAGRDTVRSLGLPHAFVWSAGSGMVDIGASPGVTSSGAAAINNNGVVTGTFHSAFAHHAFRWTLGSGLEDLGALTEEGASFGEALNEAGDIAGQATTANGRRHAVIWTRRGGPVDIDAFDSVDSTPVAVGARGEVAGNRLLPPPQASFAPSCGRGPVAWWTSERRAAPRRSCSR